MELRAVPAAVQAGGFVSLLSLSSSACFPSTYFILRHCFSPFSPLSSLYLCLVSHQKSHCMGLLALLSLSPFLFSSACLNFGPLCFFLYSFLRYFSVENGLLLFSPSPQSIIFLHALSASLAAVVSNWCFSVSAFILCLFFFFPLPLIVPIFASHLPPPPFCICGKRQASDRLPPCLCALDSIL